MSRFKKSMAKQFLPYVTSVVMFTEKLKVSKKLKKTKDILFKRILPVGAAGASLLTLAGCGAEHQEVENLQQQIEILEQENEDLSKRMESIETKKEELEQERKDLQYQIYQLEEKNEGLQLTIDRINTPSAVSNHVDDEEAISLFYKDGKLDVDEISGVFCFSSEVKDMHYSPGYAIGYSIQPDIFGYYSMNIDHFYQIITVNNVNYLVDANDYSKVYLRGFSKILNPFYLECYDSTYGGSDMKGEYSGYVLPYYDDAGRFYLADLDTFEPLLYGVDPIDFTDYKHDYTSEQKASENMVRNWFTCNTEYFKAYDAAYNGNDKEGKYSGKAFIFYKNGIPYCVDANDFTKVLAVSFDKISSYTRDDQVAIIEIHYQDGHIDYYHADAFHPEASDVLTSKDSVRERILK